jgi:anti-anti-sigma factor
MQLTLQAESVGNIQLIRCHGRLVVGEELHHFQQEFERHSLGTKKFVLHMGGVRFMDSGGLGALVRLAGVMRSYHGDLKLCEVSPPVFQILETTALLHVFHTYESEQEAINAFFHRHGADGLRTLGMGEKILCVDTSLDLLAYLHALLKRSGFQSYTTGSLADANTLIVATKPVAIVCGPGLLANDFALQSLRQTAPHTRFMYLESDFSAEDAAAAGMHFVEDLRVLLNS